MGDHDDANVAEYIARDLLREVLAGAEGWRLKAVLEEVCVAPCKVEPFEMLCDGFAAQVVKFIFFPDGEGQPWVHVLCGVQR